MQIVRRIFQVTEWFSLKDGFQWKYLSRTQVRWAGPLPIVPLNGSLDRYPDLEWTGILKRSQCIVFLSFFCGSHGHSVGLYEYQPHSPWVGLTWKNSHNLHLCFSQSFGEKLNHRIRVEILWPRFRFVDNRKNTKKWRQWKKRESLGVIGWVACS